MAASLPAGLFLTGQDAAALDAVLRGAIRGLLRHGRLARVS